MMHRVSVTLLIVSAALAGCVATPPPTPGRETDRGVTDQARRACRTEAQRQGIKVRAVEQALFLGGTRYQLVMRASGAHGPEQVRCVYNAQYGVARIEAPPEPDQNVLARARHACVNEAQRKGFSVAGVDRTIDLGDMRYQVTLRTSGQRGRVPLTCIYNAKFQTVRIQ